MAAAIESDIITCEINLQPLTSCLRQICKPTNDVFKALMGKYLRFVAETLAAQEVQHSQEIQQVERELGQGLNING